MCISLRQLSSLSHRRTLQMAHPCKYAGNSVDLQGLNVFKGRISVADIIGRSRTYCGFRAGLVKSWDISIDLVNVLKHEIRDGQLGFRGKRVLEADEAKEFISYDMDVRKLADGGSDADDDNEGKAGHSAFCIYLEEVHRFGCSMLDLGLDLLPPLVVDVGISMLQLAGESGDEGIGRAMKEMDVWDVEPATRASIAALKALKEVAFDGSWSIKECQHCSKTLAEGKLARMPCSHVVFHWECIESWLKDIHMCPFCRFTMPSADLYSNWY
ncbi:hypothetical protein C3L33_09776, partial [Rhododendron williamsianum]